MRYGRVEGVPDFDFFEFSKKKTKYCLLIPIINEGDRIIKELERAKKAGVDVLCDIIICDGDSNDGCTEQSRLKELGVNTLLVKKDIGRQGAQLRMGIYFAQLRDYDGIITIDGNNKDSIESVPLFIEKLDLGYDFIQGSRYVEGGRGINTPKSRHFAVTHIHAPMISLIAGKRFTDTTNAFRGYSKKYLTDERVKPLRDIFVTYELLAYLSVRASRLGMNTCEVPVIREYPDSGKVPTKISPIKGNFSLLKILFELAYGKFNP